MRKITRGAAAVLAAAVLACSENTGPGNLDSGRFSFTISGPVDETVTGNAFYAADQDGLTIVLGTSQRSVVVGRVNPAVPSAGTYVIRNPEASPPADEFVLEAIFGSGTSFSYLCSATGGTLTITGSSPNLVGTFSGPVDCFVASSNSTASGNITGSFNAPNGTLE